MTKHPFEAPFASAASAIMTCTGSEANDIALRMAHSLGSPKRKYHL